MIAKEAGAPVVPSKIQPGAPISCMSMPEPKKVSRFCNRCNQVDPLERNHDYRVFVDRVGNGWRCEIPFHCVHAIVMGGQIHSCRVRTAFLNAESEDGGA